MKWTRFWRFSGLEVSKKTNNTKILILIWLHFFIKMHKEPLQLLRDGTPNNSVGLDSSMGRARKMRRAREASKSARLTFLARYHLGFVSHLRVGIVNPFLYCSLCVYNSPRWRWVIVLVNTKPVNSQRSKRKEGGGGGGGDGGGDGGGGGEWSKVRATNHFYSRFWPD